MPKPPDGPQPQPTAEGSAYDARDRLLARL